MLETHWKEILDLARFAPSGDNMQPWCVSRVAADTLAIHFDSRSADEDLYKVDLMGEYISIGAFLETLCWASRSLGYTPVVTLRMEGDVIALLRISRDPETQPDPELAQIIRTRSTDRRAFLKTPLDQETLRTLKMLLPATEGHLEVYEKKSHLKVFGDIMALHDTFFWLTPELREAMIGSFRYVDPKTLHDGLSLSRLGLGWETSLVEYTFKIARRLPLLWHFIVRRAKQRQRSRVFESGAIAMLTVTPDIETEFFSPATYMKGGRIFQRLWLECTRHGLVLQPCFGPVALLWHARNKKDIFTERPEEREAVLTLIAQHFPQTENTLPIMFFRIGYPKYAPIPHSPRRMVEELLQSASRTLDHS